MEGFAVDCTCGITAEAPTEEELFVFVRKHVHDDHPPDKQLNDEEIRDFLDKNAYRRDASA